eukprot:5591511-Pyramimonas_sp.AAC.1
MSTIRNERRVSVLGSRASRTGHMVSLWRSPQRRNHACMPSWLDITHASSSHMNSRGARRVLSLDAVGLRSAAFSN